MTGLLYTHFHDNINFLNNPSYLKSEKPVCCINFLQQLTLYRLSLKYYSVVTFRTVIEDWVRLGNIHVVHFENVLSNRVKELRRILDFLDIKIDQRRNLPEIVSTFGGYIFKTPCTSVHRVLFHFYF